MKIKACNFFSQLLRNMNIFRRDDNSTESHQRSECPGVLNSQSRIVDLEKTKTEAVLLQTQKLRAAELARTNSVLRRLGLYSQQDPLPSPQPPAALRGMPASSLRGCRMRRPVSLVSPSNLTREDTEQTQRYQRSPGTQDGDVDDLIPGRDQISSLSASMCSEDTLSTTDAHTPCELRTISLICTQSPPPPPSAPLLKRRVNRLPVMKTELSRADKEVGGGYRLLTAQHHMEVIRKGVKNLQGNSVALMPRPPAPTTRKPVVAPLTPAPPPKLSLPKKRATHGRCVRPPKKTDVTCRFQTAERQSQEDLQPLSNPAESLSLCFKLLDSDDWMKKVKGLRCIQALAQHHPDTLMPKLHEVCLAVIEEVKNLRSSVACAAMDTIRCLYVHLQRDMDTEAERTGRALLLKIAQACGNAFVQQQANVALEALVQNCSPGRVLPALLNAGLSHLSTAVRASTAQQLHLLTDRLGATVVLTAGQSFTQRFLTAVSQMSVDAAAEVRPHGRAILQKLALHSDFIKVWQKTVAKKNGCSLEMVLRNVVKK